MPYNPLFQPSGPDPLEQAIEQLRLSARTRQGGAGPINLEKQMSPQGYPRQYLAPKPPQLEPTLRTGTSEIAEKISMVQRYADLKGLSYPNAASLFEGATYEELLEALRKAEEERRTMLERNRPGLF